MNVALLEPSTPLPPGVRACVTLRGVDAEGDFAARVEEGVAGGSEGAARRDHLRALLGVERIEFLDQVHGIDVHRVGAGAPASTPRADAAVTTCHGVACAVLTADCLPVLFWTESGECVGAAHGGWRGLAAGVLEATLDAMRAASGVAPESVSAWLGAAIGPESFEVGPEVREAFLARRRTTVPAGELAKCFRAGRGDRWFADLYSLARVRLAAAGVTAVTGGGFDTFADAARFHSYRRDGTHAGRQASLIWIDGVSRSS